MTDARTPEYRTLELDSSNELMEYDGRRVLGRYAEAVDHVRRAGVGRARMGQIMFDAGQFGHAAADWLCAAECFYLATDPEQMRDYFERVKQLDREGKIPADRRDIHTALREREQQLRTLGAKVAV